MIKCYPLLIINYHAILFKGSSQKLKLEKFHGVLIILFYVSLISPRLHRICFLYWRHKKVTTFQQVTGGNTLSLVLKRMVGHFLKIQPIKEILEFQDWKRGYEVYTKKKISN